MIRTSLVINLYFTVVYKTRIRFIETVTQHQSVTVTMKLQQWNIFHAST